MGKYDPLREHLRAHSAAELTMTLAEIETVLGTPLPKGAGRPEWWSDPNSTSISDHRLAWIGAGYDAVMRGGTKVLFTKVGR